MHNAGLPAGNSAVDEILNDIVHRQGTPIIDNLIDAILTDIPSGFLAIIFHQPKILMPKNGKEDPLVYFNYLSFEICDGRVTRFPDHESASTRFNYLVSLESIRTLRDGICSTFFSPDLPLDIAKRMHEVSSIYFMTSDSYGHFIDNTSRLIARLLSTSHEKIDLPQIATLVRERFGVETLYIAVRDPMRLNLEQAVASDFEVQFASPLVAGIFRQSRCVNDVIRSLRTGNDYSGASGNLYYKLIPISLPKSIYDPGPFTPNDPPREILEYTKPDPQRYFPIGVFSVISPNKPVDRMCHATSRHLAAEIAGTRKIAQQLRSINDLHIQISSVGDRLLREPLRSQTELIELFANYARRVTETVVKLTSSHSATVRLFNPFHGVLRAVASSFGESLSSASRVASDITLEDPSTSLNAFVFSRWEHDKFLHVPDINNISPDLVRCGLVKTLSRREETKSELCIKLTKSGVPIGTLNVEAPYELALGKELLYCQAAAHLLEEFFDTALKSSDSGWLPKISMSHVLHHRIQKVRRERPDLSEILDFIEKPMPARTVELNRPAGLVSIGTLKSSIANNIPNVSAEQLDRLVRLAGTSDVEIRPDAADLLSIIIETLAENSRVHAHINKDTLSLYMLPKSGNPNRLVIEYRSHSARQPVELLDQLGIAPVWQEDDHSYHFGMFLAGAHARLLGGLIYVDAERRNSRKTRPVRIEITLPLSSL